jgi:quinoprotein glucose dehydrogenase
LISADTRFPDGLANRSGLVGKYVTGHRPMTAYVEVPMKLYPGVYTADSLLSKKFQRPGRLERYVRHDLRIWESTVGRRPRLRNDAGEILLGDSVLDDWRGRTGQGAARLRAYYDVLPARDSALTLDPTRRNEWGDVMPRIDFVDSEESLRLREHTETQIRNVFESLVRAGGGRILSTNVQNAYDHPGGGCRMGDDPATSVVDSFGRSHDHDNLFVIGAPTIVTAGCANGTLTTSALSLRSAVEIGRELPVRRV